MNKWGQALQSLAPSAGDPGMGSGNIPFAPGIMTGQQSSPGSSGQLFRGLDQTMKGQQLRQGMQQATGTPSGQPGSDQPPQMGMPQGIGWTPDVQAQVMDYLMNMLRSTGKNWRMTTTGGTTNQTEGY